MDEQDEISRHWFDPGRVQLELVDDVSAAFDEEALIALSGAPSNSVVTVRKATSQPHSGEALAPEAIRLEVHHEAAFSMNRLIQQRTSGEWFIRNTKFRIRHEYSGRRLSARSLLVQARAAQALGFQEIVLDAVGDYTLANLKFREDRWVGYWVWPRLGFDADIPASALRCLPERLRGCTRVSELMHTAENQDLWLLHGETLENAKFDLTGDSLSWQLLAKYAQERNIKV